MRKMSIAVLAVSVLCAGLACAEAVYAQTRIGVHEVLPEGIKLGMSYQKAVKILGEPIHREVRSNFYGKGKALFRTGENNYILLHLRLGRVKYIDLFEDLSYDAVLQRFNESM